MLCRRGRVVLRCVAVPPASWADWQQRAGLTTARWGDAADAMPCLQRDAYYSLVCYPCACHLSARHISSAPMFSIRSFAGGFQNPGEWFRLSVFLSPLICPMKACQSGKGGAGGMAVWPIFDAPETKRKQYIATGIMLSLSHERHYGPLCPD